MAEDFLENRDLENAAIYFAKCGSIDIDLVCAKFLRIEFEEDYLNLEVSRCLLKYLRKKYLQADPDTKVYLITTMIDLYATAISSQYSTTNLQEQQETLTILRAMRTEFSKLVNSDEISSILSQNEST